ncbi:MAG: threonine synthase [Candidatus Tectomicrobia bacterium]|uniref:Threonine synthase n=1 Tax=Tectimicrobiota bacterium TaxID=2528274 RepID=A0A937W1L7_UNCTE|nr:threonine synthase [Candidatus Tectomicrobia bacterium]
MFSYFDHLECSACDATYASTALVNLCTCGAPLLARYRLEDAAAALDRTNLHGTTLWRYHAMLPVQSPAGVVSLGEGMTPLLRADRLGKRLGLNHLYIKDESLNPTGSFKARGLALAIARAAELGVTRVAVPSAGNAGGATAAYAARAGLESYVFMPRDVPRAFIVECQINGAHVELVDGLITDAGRRVAAGRDEYGWFDLSTLKEPYRVEGKKTMGYELAEQFDWELPHVIIYPTGGGTGLIGMWKSFDEMEALGWIDSHRPRMVTVQAEGCAPIVRAFQSGATRAEPWQNATTMAAGLRVPSAVGDALMLRALRESEGTAVAVSEAEILESVQAIGASEGMFVCPEGGAALAGLRRLIAEGWIDPEERVVLFNTGSGLKYLDALPPDFH